MYFQARPDSLHTCHRFQKIVQLPAKQRGCHIITRNLLQELPELGEYEVGMANLFGENSHQLSFPLADHPFCPLTMSMIFAVMHTSASLTINENASSDVPLDLNVSFTMLAWGATPVLWFLQIAMPMQRSIVLTWLLKHRLMARDCDPASFTWSMVWHSCTFSE